MRIVLGVAGGIAAYKVVLVLRLLTEAGHQVRVIPTAAALEFVGRATWEALSRQPVATSVFHATDTVDHVRLGQEADLVIVAPATADVLARAAAGRADDLLTATLLTATCPVLFVPAMHTEMWQHPATRANVATLRSRGAQVLDPDSGRLTGADTGPGRLPEPEQIVSAALALVDHCGAHPHLTDNPPAGRWTGRHVAISAGGTREPLDPVRFLGNRSSGRQGIALAAAAAARGAQVHLVVANVDDSLLQTLPQAVRIERVETTAELHRAMVQAAQRADVVMMAAAVADFRPVTAQDAKIKTHAADGSRHDNPVIDLVANPDILAGLVDSRRPGQLIVGFAAETGDDAQILKYGQDKARRKQADLLAVNRVGGGAGFGDVPNAVMILNADGDCVARSAGTKADVAEGVLDALDALER